MNTQMIRRLAIETDAWCDQFQLEDPYYTAHWEEKFAQLIVKECIDKIETYKIYVGNSAAGELACEWTYDALKEIRDDIKETFGIE